MRELDLSNIDEIAAAFDAGHILAIPTDTVYGVAASLRHPVAVSRLFDLKQRPDSVALPVLVASADALDGLGVTWNDAASRLAGEYWPGALTIIVPAISSVAAIVGATDSVGVRCPGDQALRAVLARTGPLAVTSANLHGQPPCRSTADVRVTFADSHELWGVVDGGVRDGVVSTVVDVASSPWVIRRDGSVSPSDIQRTLDQVG